MERILTPLVPPPIDLVGPGIPLRLLQFGECECRNAISLTDAQWDNKLDVLGCWGIGSQIGARD